ncbi:hypothetical protein BGZ73_001182 [Actinomortierella ambigua]|nr:hypothetical protein BGZ73_001182 [Actinomortierella ambigua]
MTLEFSHGDKSDRWTVPFYSDMDSAATTDIPVSKGERKVTPCFFLPASFGTLKPDSQVKVTLTGNLSTNNSEILCVTGYITTK